MALISEKIVYGFFPVLISILEFRDFNFYDCLIPLGLKLEAGEIEVGEFAYVLNFNCILL